MPGPGLLAVLAVAEFMLTLDLSIVNVAVPAIGASLRLDTSSLQWVVNGYALTFAGFLLLGGRAADVFGGRRVFLAALTCFSLASLASGLASDGPVLLVFRTLQGMAAGLLAPATLSSLILAYRDSDTRNRALAVWTAVAIGGGVAGGLIGGVLTSMLSWRWIFFVNVPVGAALLAAASWRLRLPRPAAAPARLDVPGAVTVTGGLTVLVWTLMQAGETGWGSAEVIVGVLLAAMLLAAFMLIEARLMTAPLVPLSVVRARPVWVGNLVSVLSFMPVPATWFLLTLYLQNVRHYGPLGTGLMFLPLSAAVIVGMQASFGLLLRFGQRTVLLTGGLCAAAGLCWLARLTPGTGLAWVITPAAIAMAGGGLMTAPATVAATSTAPEHEGLASGLLNTSRQAGGALGLALLGTIAGASRSAAPPAVLTVGYAHALDAGALVYLLTAIAGAIALPGRHDEPARNTLAISRKGARHEQLHRPGTRLPARRAATGTHRYRGGRRHPARHTGRLVLQRSRRHY